MTAKRLSLKERREQRRAKRPRTREVPIPSLLPVVTVKPQARQER